MLFSVLIPLYNSEEYISECLDSILCQNFSDYEIVIVDDGSTDNSGHIVDDYQKENPGKLKVIHKENSGVLLTRRRAIQEAEGNYIIWVDSDDVIKQNMMQELYNEIVNKNPDVIIFNYEMYCSPQKVIRTMNIPDGSIIDCEHKHDIYLQMLIGKHMNELCTKCIRREIIDSEDYSDYRHVRMGDDLFCLFPIMDAATSIEYIDKAYYQVRVVSSSITHTNDYMSYYSYRTIYERAHSYMEKWRLSAEDCSKARDVFANKVVDCVVQCINNCHHNIDNYFALAKQVRDDEKKVQIFSGGNRAFRSKFYKYCYNLLFSRHDWALYCFARAVGYVSKVKHKRR